MTKWAVCGVGLLLVVLPACVAVPISVPERAVAGSEVTPAMTAPDPAGRHHAERGHPIAG